MKQTTLYTCSNCTYEALKWLGRCPQCEAWNSFKEEVRAQTTNVKQRSIKAHARPSKTLASVLGNLQEQKRIELHLNEIDRVLGGGVVPGSLILLTGEPGIGKSTLTLQVAEKIALAGKKILYASGEESEEQISMRADRLQLQLHSLELISETNIETILATAETLAADFLIIDSIQVMTSQLPQGAAGTVSQVRFCTEQICAFAKQRGIAVLLIGHVTKDGTLAGPRVLEHLVDTVLYLQGDRSHEVRILRTVKNRFGSASEVGVFEMAENGLQEAKNPTAFFVQNRDAHLVGSALTVTTEGSRPMIVEVQALTSPTTFGYPRRTASGFDVNRLHLLLAVLQKHCNVNLANQDVYINIVGGYELDDPYADLAICMAILSSHYQIALPANTVFVGEVGLGGQLCIRKDIQKRSNELKKLNLELIAQYGTMAQVAAKFLKSKTRLQSE